MPEILDYILKTLQYFTDNKIIDMWVALILAVSVVLIYASLLRMDSISRLVSVIKNRKENALINIVRDDDIPSETKACARLELKRIKNKKLCGFDDVIRQNYCIILANKHYELITVFFFRKFRANIVLGKNQIPLIEIGKGIWFEWSIGVIYTLQFFILAIFFISLSIFNPGQIPLWKLAILYSSVLVLVGFGVLMSKQFPSLGDIRLLKELKRREEQATD